MAGYGIEQVNIPALLGLHQQMKQQQLENAYRAQQIARQRRLDQEAETRRELLRKVFSRDGKATATPAPSPTPAPAATAAPAASDLDQFMPGSVPGTLANGQPVGGDPVDQPAEVTAISPTELVDPAQLPPRTDGLSINHDALRELYAVDPEAAIQIQKTVFDMDKAAADRIAQRGTAMAEVSGALAGIPLDQRAAAFRQQVPRLLALGFSPEELNQTDLTDAGLNRYYRAGMSMEQLIADQKEQRRAGESEREYQLRVQAAEETRRHNRASEGVAAGNLALSRQRESRIRKWGPQAIIVGGTAAPRTDTSDLDY